MVDLLQGYLIVVLEVIYCKIFFDTFCKQNIFTRRNQYLYFFLLSVADFVFVLALSEYFLLKEFFIILATSIGMKFYTRKSMKRNIVLTIIYQGILLITDYITIIIKSIFFPKIDFTSAIAGIMFLLLDKIILFLFVIIIKRIFCKKEFEVLQDADWLKFLFFPLFTICIITAMISNGIEDMTEHGDELFIVISVGLVGMNIVVFYLLNDIVYTEKRLREKQMFELETKNQLQLYETLSQNIDKQRKLSHEYQNQINIIQELCQKGLINELNGYLAEINGEIKHDMDCIETHHHIINTIINQKYYESSSKGILFLCKINDMSKLNIKNKDIALLLSNLLNNAIEACEKLEEQKYIKVKLILKSNKLIFSIKNSYNGKVIKTGNQLETSKEIDVESHGYGLKNVIKVVKDNDGDYVIRTTDTEFYISICIPQNLL
jgi:signal transduction histidine kinase